MTTKKYKHYTYTGSERFFRHKGSERFFRCKGFRRREVMAGQVSRR